MTTFYVKVRTDRDEFHVDTSGTYPRVDLTAPAEQGRANTELVKKLSDILGEQVGIVSGHRSRRKQLAVDLTEPEMHAKLEDA